MTRVGDRCVTASPMCPSGAVLVGGKRVFARSDGGPLEAGVTVVVVGDEPAGLVVRPLEQGRETERLPNHGRPVFATPREREAAARARKDEVGLQHDAARRLRGTVFGTVGGVLAAEVSLAVLWNRIAGEDASPLVFVVGAAVLGALWGAVVYWFVERVFGALSPMFRVFSVFLTVLGLVGTVGGAVVGGLAWGLEGALAVAPLTTALFAGALPGFFLVSSGVADVDGPV